MTPEDSNPIALTGRDYSSIYTPNAIQPHGVLLALSTPNLTILKVSDNTSSFFDIDAAQLLGQSLGQWLAQWLDPAQVADIRQCCQEDLGSLNPIRLTLQNQTFTAIAHHTETAIILELEPIHPDGVAQSTNSAAAHQRARKAIAKLQKIKPLGKFLQQVVIEVQALVGCDRVHIYQFDNQGAGSVIAEKKRADLPSYLGLHFPSFDIPEESRHLYRQGLLRFVPDVSAVPVALVGVDQAPLNMGLAMLRSIDPCCVQYYQNLDSAALFVVALLKDEQLWGLISCHHQTPKWLSFEIRSACELLGQFVSLQLAHRVDHAEFHDWVTLKSLQSDLLESISQAQNLRDALVTPAPRLLDFVHATGAAICLTDEITLVGDTPSESEIAQLLAWVEDHTSDSLFHTDSLPKLYPAAIAFKDTASGLLVLRISQVQKYYVLWFRPEVLQTVNWAGNPTTSMEVDAEGNFRVSRRSSFERWQETVQLTSLPWSVAELDNVLELRTAIVGIVLAKADELARLNLALERSNRELDSFAFAASHDLKEPLRGIYNNTIILLEDYADQLDREGIEGLQTTMRLARRMETLVNTLLHFSQLGNVELHPSPTDLNQLVEQTVKMLQASRPKVPLEVRMPRSLPTLECDPVLLSEVFSNLLGNAFKYNTQTQPWAEVGYLAGEALRDLKPPRSLHESSTSLVFYIRDNGIGIRSHHYDLIFKLFKRLHAQEDFGGGTGAGLTIAKKIIERHGGQLWVESIYQEGSTFYFSLE